MQEQVKVVANDTVVIIVNRNDKRNNTYDVTPVSVAIGRIDENGLFNSEDHKYICGNLLSDYIDCKDMQEFYIKPISIKELKKKYPNIKDMSNIIIEYYNEIASNLMLVAKDGNGLHLYSKPYSVLDASISDGLIKNIDREPKPLQIIKKEIVKKVPSTIAIDLLDFEKYLKQRVLENDEIIEDFATTIALNCSATNPRDVESMLSIGSTGTGKTSTYEAAAEYLNLPLTIFDCKSLTAPGYKGKDTDDIFREVMKNSSYKRDVAERSILMLDEIDKIIDHGSQVNDVDVQHTLLKVLDGHKYTFQMEPNSGRSLELNTSFMTIGACGAFESLITRKTQPKHLGFTDDKREVITEFDITDDDLVEEGIIRELAGRLRNRYIYKSLTEDSLRKIILTGLNSPLLRKINRYNEEFNCDVEYDDSFIDALIAETIKAKIGGRSLDKTVSTIFKRTDRELFLRKEDGLRKKLVITADTVMDNHLFKL